MGRFRKAITASFFMVFAGATIAEHPAKLDPLPENFCTQLFELDEPIWHSTEPVQQFLRMETEGKTLPIKLPRNYLEDRWDFNEGYTVVSHGFQVDLQGFAPVYDRDRRALWDTHGRRDVGIVISDVVVSLSEIFTIGLRIDYLKVEEFGGLVEHYDEELDLTRVEPRRPHPKHRIWYKLQSEGGEFTDAIQCRRPGDGVQQSCRHHYRTQDVDVTAVFAAEYLSQWKLIKSNISTFLGCMLAEEDSPE